MINTYSLNKMLVENRQNLLRYDLIDVYNIIFPKKGAFTEGHPDYGQLEMDDDYNAREKNANAMMTLY